jgi:thioredoxin 1
MAQEFNEANFDEEVLKSDQPVLVDFWAEWCMPCKMLAPTIDELATEFEGRAKVGKLDTDGNRELATKFQIMAIPTLILFKGGEAVMQFRGPTSSDKADIAKAIEEQIAG